MQSAIIDPNDVTIYDRSDQELEQFLLFSIVVAGKTAKVQAKLLHDFFQIGCRRLGVPTADPMGVVGGLEFIGQLDEALRESKLGQYRRLNKCFSELYCEYANLRLNLRTCSCEDLERIHGIGFKTSRFFIVHSRNNANYAVLDTHILRYMRDVLKIDAPKSTPGNKAEYARLERIWLNHCREIGKTPASYDLEIWTQYSSGLVAT